MVDKSVAELGRCGGPHAELPTALASMRGKTAFVILIDSDERLQVFSTIQPRDLPNAEVPTRIIFDFSGQRVNLGAVIGLVRIWNGLACEGDEHATLARFIGYVDFFELVREEDLEFCGLIGLRLIPAHADFLKAKDSEARLAVAVQQLTRQ